MDNNKFNAPWRRGDFVQTDIYAAGNSRVASVNEEHEDAFELTGLIIAAPNMREWLQQIALDRCTCDAWGTKAVEANPAEHDVWCMYREMTGYQDTAEKETP